MGNGANLLGPMTRYLFTDNEAYDILFSYGNEKSGTWRVHMGKITIYIVCLLFFSTLTYVCVMVKLYNQDIDKKITLFLLLTNGWLFSSPLILFTMLNNLLDRKSFIFLLLTSILFLLVGLIQVSHVQRVHTKLKKKELLFIAAFFAAVILLFNLIKPKDTFKIVLPIFLVLVVFISFHFMKQNNNKISRIGILYILSSCVALIFIEFFQRDLDKSLFCIITICAGFFSLIGFILFFFEGFHVRLLEKMKELSLKNMQLLQAEEEISKLAYYDQVTGLLNSCSLRRDLPQYLKASGDQYILFINLDNFKKVNNFKGFFKGNLILRKLSDILKQNIDGEDRVYRFNGDQFVIIHKGSRGSGEDLAKRMITALNSEQDVMKGHNLKMGASVGITKIEPFKNYDILIKEAELAMYKVKRTQKNNYLFYTPGMDEEFQNEFMLERKIKEAAKNRNWMVAFQPQVSLETGTIIGVEALIRWKDDNGNLISPSIFIPIAEKMGLIIPIGDYVLEETFKVIQDLNEEGYDYLSYSINISPYQIYEENFVNKLESLLKQYNVKYCQITLEITENSLMEDIGQARIVLNQIKSLNIKVSLDDFGVGYSSLNYFASLPIDEVKFDRNFTKDLRGNSKNCAILQSFTELAHTLGIKVIIEGIEYIDQLEIAKSLKCDIYQGYYFSRPISIEQFRQIV